MQQNTTKPQLMNIAGPVGQLEMMVQWPALDSESPVVIICHPLTTEQGTMHNKVVTILAKTFASMQMPTVRFNCRGAGGSEGAFDQGRGEQEDLQAVMAWVKDQWPGRSVALAGFSFGSYVSAAVANRIKVDFLVSIAPAVDRWAYDVLTGIACPWWVVFGDQDEVVSVASMRDFVNRPPSPLVAAEIPGAGHFFHGKLMDLRDVLLDIMSV